jgi:ADP-ribose pyrophosphatase YjhB (NUDIX family)
VNPAAAVAVIIINEKDEMLVCERAKDPAKGTLDLPGGFVDENETVEEAVFREIKEELGVELQNREYLFSLPNEYLYSGWTLPTIDLFFESRVDSHFHPQPADDVAACYFLPFSQIDVQSFGLMSVRNAVDKFLTEKKTLKTIKNL